MTLEALEERVELLYKAQAPPEEMAGPALELVTARIDAEWPHLASLDAMRYEASWSDAQKLSLIRRFTLHGMEAQAIVLCHRWTLTRRFAKKHHDLFRTLFPKLPPHPNDKDTEEP